MGLFAKLFSKKEKPAKEAEEDKIIFDSPYCKFYYLCNPGSDEIGYEGEIKWVDRKNVFNQAVFFPDTTLFLYFDTDAPDNTGTAVCYPILERYISDMERTDSDVKRRVARYFFLNPNVSTDDDSEQNIIDLMEIFWMSAYRNGDVKFGIETYINDVDDVIVTYKADGSKEIKYTDEYHEHEYCEKM